MGKQPVYYPICLNVCRKRCVVVGGGDVAARKANALLDAGADVTVVSPEVCDELSGRDDLTVVRRAWQDADLDGASLVVAATDDSCLNQRVARVARERRVLCNVVDDASLSDFIVPASVRRGALVISVSTGGASPALARSIRERLENMFGQEYADYLEILSSMREDIIRSVSDEGARREIFESLADSRFLTVLREEGKAHARREMERLVRRLVHDHEDEHTG